MSTVIHTPHGPTLARGVTSGRRDFLVIGTQPIHFVSPNGVERRYRPGDVVPREVLATDKYTLHALLATGSITELPAADLGPPAFSREETADILARAHLTEEQRGELEELDELVEAAELRIADLEARRAELARAIRDEDDDARMVSHERALLAIEPRARAAANALRKATRARELWMGRRQAERDRAHAEERAAAHRRWHLECLAVGRLARELGLAQRRLRELAGELKVTATARPGISVALSACQEVLRIAQNEHGGRGSVTDADIVHHMVLDPAILAEEA